ncbi:hypothetical protein TPR58_13320 [Sphingomonas sp. HF-S3]|uniref:Uncharacterized protein n=1 Tax=Sphingomonas rustica TaxID=3103142 RepID=A0ABV0BDL0_9SPHN
MEKLGERPRARPTISDIFDRIEAIYLRVLRAIVLIIATLLLIYVAYLGVTGLYALSRSPDSVQETAATVAANEIVDAEEAEVRREATRTPVANAEHQKFFSDFVSRYYALFRGKFEPYRQPTDKVLTRDEFDDNFVQSELRLAAVTDGSRLFDQDKADLEALLATMTAAAAEPKATVRLQRYKTAKKVAAKREVRKTRTAYRSGWNSYSTACEDWYYSPMGCAERRAVEVPYTDTITVMEFPKGTQSHAQIFRAMQDQYFSLLESRRSANATDAENQRMEILIGKDQAWTDFGRAVQIFGGFVILMFFFLLIAIERHQRHISAALPGETRQPAEEAINP